MTIIKEQTESHCVIRTRKYDKSLSHILELFDIAKKDFPEIKPEDVEVIFYAGKRHANTYGLEFKKPEGADVSEDYKRISELESTF